MYGKLSVITVAAGLVLTGCSSADAPVATQSASQPALSETALDGRDVQVQLNDAVKNGDVELALLAIDAGADVNDYESQDMSPFAIAIMHDDADMVVALIGAGATIDWPEYSYTEISLAARHASAEVIASLIDGGGSVNGLGDGLGGPLINASYRGDLEVLETILMAGADPNAYGTLDNLEAPALFVAARRGDLAVIELLLRYGASTEGRDPNGYAPSDWARTEGHAEAADYLASIGA